MGFELRDDADLNLSEEGYIKPTPDAQLPLDVCSSTYGCFVFDSNGAELRYNYVQDWEDDPKLYVVGTATGLRDAYENPIETLESAFDFESIHQFYDANYPTDEVPCRQTYEADFFENRKLPPIGNGEEPDPMESPYTVEIDDHYAEERPSTIFLVEEETGDFVTEWVVERSEDKDANVRLGAEVAWTIRLAYERPWKLCQ